MNFMPDTQTIFVSYNQSDRAWAEWIAWELEEHDFETIIQAWDFRQNFVLEMDQATKVADQTIAVLSQHYIDANFTHPEWAAAFAQDPKSEKGSLIPIRVGDVKLDGLLAQINYVDFIGKDEETASELLIARIKGLRGKPAKPPAFPGKPATKPKPHFPSDNTAIDRIWNIPHARNPNFTGREALLDELMNRLNSGEPAALVQAIAGLGGVGKTQLAAEYAYRRKNAYGVVWWLRAEELTTLGNDYAALAERLGMAVQNVSEQKVIVEAVRRWLDENKGWLLIFDNAEDQKSLQPYLPLNRLGHVIITSRNPAWSGIARPLKVEEMTKPEAVEFLLRDGALADKSQAEKLAEDLGFLPLALAQAKAYMDETGTTLDAYRELFKEHRRDLLDEARVIDYPVSVAATWELSFAAAMKQTVMSADLINVCAFLAPDAIPLDLFSNGRDHLPEAFAAACQNALKLNETVAALRRYSLVETGDRTLSFHRLVQAVARDRLSEPEKKHWSAVAAQLVNAALPDDSYDARHWSVYENALPHAITASGHVRLYGTAPEIAGRILNYIGDYLRSRADFTVAEEYLKCSLEIREKTFEPEHPEIAESLSNLGWQYSDQGQHVKAETHHLRALEIREKTLGPEHLDTAQSLNNLAAHYSYQGQHNKAETLHLRALEIREKTLGSEHPDIAQSLNSLAANYGSQGQHKKAEAPLVRALEIRRKTLGPEHPETAQNLTNLAAYYGSLGQHKKAAAFLVHALAIFEKTLGPEHLRTIEAIIKLAKSKEGIRKKGEARLFYLRALELGEKLFDAEPDNIPVKNACSVIRLGLARTSDQDPVTNPNRKVGRNDPCPCGSGRKFKQCGMIDDPGHVKVAS